MATWEQGRGCQQVFPFGKGSSLLSYTEWHEPVYPMPQLLVQTGLHRRDRAVESLTPTLCWAVRA